MAVRGPANQQRGHRPRQPAGSADFSQSTEHRVIGNGRGGSAGYGGIAFPPAETRYRMMLGTSVNQSPSGDESIPIDGLFFHAEILAAMADQLVCLFERAFV